MTLLSDDPVITDSLPNDVKEYLAESISSLQRARLETLKTQHLKIFSTAETSICCERPGRQLISLCVKFWTLILRIKTRRTLRHSLTT